MSRDLEVCEGFSWIGQSFASCDDCGHPYWDHAHDRQIDKTKPLFSAGSEILVPITREQADACRRKWCPTCRGASRETVGLVCQTCGADYGTGPVPAAPEEGK